MKRPARCKKEGPLTESRISQSSAESDRQRTTPCCSSEREDAATEQNQRGWLGSGRQAGVEGTASVDVKRAAISVAHVSLCIGVIVPAISARTGANNEVADSNVRGVVVEGELAAVVEGTVARTRDEGLGQSLIGRGGSHTRKDGIAGTGVVEGDVRGCDEVCRGVNRNQAGN